MAVGRSGTLTVLLSNDPFLVRIARDGTTSTLALDRPFRFPLAIVTDPEGEGWLVADGAAAVWSVAASGAVKARVRGTPLVRPSGLAIGPDGTLFVADPGAQQVFRVGRDGAVTPLLSATEPSQ